MLKQLNYLIQVGKGWRRINVCNKYTYDRKVHFKDCIINIKVNKIPILIQESMMN